MRREPIVQLGAKASQFGLDPLFVLLPGFLFARQIGVRDAIHGILPVLRIEGRKQHRLQSVVFLLSDRLELMVMTPRAMRGQPQQRRRGHLHRRLERRSPVDLKGLWFLHADVGPVLPVPQEMRGDQQLNGLGSRRRPRSKLR